MTKRNRTKRYNKGFSETGASRTRKSLKSFNPQSGSSNEDIIYNHHIHDFLKKILKNLSYIRMIFTKNN